MCHIILYFTIIIGFLNKPIPDTVGKKAYNITVIFTGNIRRFRRICEHIQSMVCAARPRAPPASPRAQRRGESVGRGNDQLSESSSCGFDTSTDARAQPGDRLSAGPRQVNHI